VLAAEVVPAALDGERLDRVVAMITGASRADVVGWLDDGRITRNGVVATSRSVRVAEGDRLEVTGDAAMPDAPILPDPTVEVDVVMEDPDLLVVDKPPGLVVHPGAGHATGTLVQGLLARFPEIADVGDPARPGIVHRLDKDTSGLLLVARSAEAHRALTSMLAAREVQRRYLALVWGRPEATTGLVDAPIGRSPREPTRMAVNARGKEARTRYEVQQVFEDPAEVALLECRLETGRTHQIRVHLSAIGHPVVGDDRYRGRRGRLVVPRMFLHAASLELAHPTRPDEVVSVTSPLPPDLAEVLARLS
jgi:23S rRNA pseudouridine1911/1915/1917 synthase